MRLSLSGGANLRRSPLAGAERVVNLYSEANQDNLPDSMYPRPGLVPVLRLPEAPYDTTGTLYPVRALYEGTDGTCYAVIGTLVYIINPAAGTIVNASRPFHDSTDGSNRNILADLVAPFDPAKPAVNPVSVKDNGIQTVFVCAGYSVVFGDVVDFVPTSTTSPGNPISPMNVSGGTYQYGDKSGGFLITRFVANYTGSTVVDYFDSFFVFAYVKYLLPTVPLAQNAFFLSLSYTFSCDPTYIATTTGDSNPLVTLRVFKRHLYLFGKYKTEIWWDSGSGAFPLEELPNVYFEIGCLNIACLAANDLAMFFIGVTRAGVSGVFMVEDYKPIKISNLTIDERLATFLENFGAGGAANDAYGFCYTRRGHFFYQLTFFYETWLFNILEKSWTQITSPNPTTGVPEAHRALSYGFLQGQHYVGDRGNGTIYRMDDRVQTDNGAAVVFTRGFPPLSVLPGPNGPVQWDGQRVLVNKFVVDMEGGGTSGQQVGLRISLDRGHTWSTTMLTALTGPDSAGDTTYQTQPIWRRLGSARDMRFEVEWTGPGALLGAWVDVEIQPNT